ncbi:MAG: TonB-dependent receptor, partial [Planctomycetia bacterium]|nr:TonB-dependent receptor [Planctomycetia bacterium]
NNNYSVEGENITQSYYGVPSFDHKSNMIIGGITLRTLLGKLGFGLTTLSYTQQNIQQNVFDIGLKRYPWFTRNNTISDLTFKNDWFLQTPFGEINTGISLKKIDYDHNEWLNAEITFKYDTSYWIDNEWQLPDSLIKPEIKSPIYYRPTLSHDIFAKYKKFAYYLQNKLKISEKWRLVSGIRFDYFSGTQSLVSSPRFNLQFTANPANAFHIAYGRHYQYPEYFMVLKDSLNSNLKTEYSDQFVIGLEHFFDSDFRATLEFYYKYYNDIYTYYYWSHEPETYPDQLSHTLHWENKGSRKNYGLELLLQKKLTRNWHGILSYSWNTAKAKDVRTIKQVPEPDTYMNDGKWYPWDYEVRHKLTIIGGWKKKFSSNDWYQQVKNNTLFKLLSPIIPIADEVELSFRYSYSSGRPYTERKYFPELYDWKFPDNVDWNGSRYPDYKRLDIMLDIMYLKRYNFNKMNIVMYIDFINIFNRDNVLDWIYNENGTRETVWQFKTLPIGGITIEL